MSRNPILFPDVEPRIKGCPACGHEEYVGNMVMGVLTKTCLNKECNNKWQGGLAREPCRPGEFLTPDTSKPAIVFLRPTKDGPIEEFRNPQSAGQPFRGGLPVPKEDKND